MQTRWTDRYARRTQSMRSSLVRELLKLTAQPDLISFAGGLPAADLFPIGRFQEACRRVLERAGGEALQYSATEGERPLREMIARHASRYGIAVAVDNVLVTSGSQQALDLIGKVFINPGDRVVVERPTYLGALQAWNAYQAEYVSVNVDQDGMCTSGIDAALRRGPKFIYALPNFQNPTGVDALTRAAACAHSGRRRTACRSSKTIRTGSCGMKASTFRRSSRWTPSVAVRPRLPIAATCST